MASKWFRGGLDAVEQGTDPWTGAATMKACAVLGPTIATPDLGIVTLAQFLANNSLVGTEVAIPAAPARGTTFDGVSALNFWFTNPVSFGVIGAGTSIGGAVYYTGTSASPSLATVWGCQENLGGAFPADGGTISWGSSGQNVAMKFRCLVQSNRYTFQGTLDFINSLAYGWSNAGTAWKIGYALVRSTTTATPQFPWRYMSDLPGTVIYCTGAGPGAAAMPTTLVADRIGPAINLVGIMDYYEFGVQKVNGGRVPITWNIASLTPGEVVKAVVAFLYQGTYAANAAKIIHWDDVADHTILAAQNVTYMQTTAAVMNQIYLGPTG